MASVEISKRGLFGLFFGAVAAPIAAKLPLPAKPFARWVASPPQWQSQNSAISDIVATTLRNHSGALAANMKQNNALLARLKARSS